MSRTQTLSTLTRRYDYSIDCNSDDYLWGWRLYCYLFVAIYPVGKRALLILSRAALAQGAVRQ